MYTSDQMHHEHDYHINGADPCPENWDAVEAFKAGNAAAFAELIIPLTSRMDRIAQCITHNAADTEDARQNAIVKAYVHRHQLRSADKFAAWIMQITANEALIQRRHDRPHLFSSLEDFPVSELPMKQEAPLDHLEREEEHASVWEALRSVNPKQREILMMHYWEEEPVDQIAHKLGISRDNAKTRLFRARQSLRAVIEDRA